MIIESGDEEIPSHRERSLNCKRCRIEDAASTWRRMRPGSECNFSEIDARLGRTGITQGLVSNAMDIN